jgi:hypothetical protein
MKADRRALRQIEKNSPKPLPIVTADAVIETNGTRETLPVQMFEKLPGWWSKGTEDQRGTWLTEYFRRTLKLNAEQTLVSVTCGRVHAARS